MLYVYRYNRYRSRIRESGIRVLLTNGTHLFPSGGSLPSLTIYESFLEYLSVYDRFAMIA